MKAKTLTIPEMILIAGTRVALGAGVGLLVGDRLSHDQRRAAGLPLLLIGALTTIPLAMQVVGKEEEPSAVRQAPAGASPAAPL